MATSRGHHRVNDVGTSGSIGDDARPCAVDPLPRDPARPPPRGSIAGQVGWIPGHAMSGSTDGVSGHVNSRPIRCGRGGARAEARGAMKEVRAVVVGVVAAVTSSRRPGGHALAAVAWRVTGSVDVAKGSGARAAGGESEDAGGVPSLGSRTPGGAPIPRAEVRHRVSIRAEEKGGATRGPEATRRSVTLRHRLWYQEPSSDRHAKARSRRPSSPGKTSSGVGCIPGQDISQQDRHRVSAVAGTHVIGQHVIGNHHRGGPRLPDWYHRCGCVITGETSCPGRLDPRVSTATRPWIVTG